MNELRKQGSLCDVTLVAEGRQFPVHKVVLVSSSPYFRAMFNGTMSESSQELVNLPAVQSSALRQLIEYIYSGEVEVTEENVQSLLPAANLLQLSWVRDSCCRFLQSHLHPSNCLGIRSFGKFFIENSFLTNLLSRCSFMFRFTRRQYKFYRRKLCRSRQRRRVS